jgi:hypothetical protein
MQITQSHQQPHQQRHLQQHQQQHPEAAAVLLHHPQQTRLHLLVVQRLNPQALLAAKPQVEPRLNHRSKPHLQLPDRHQRLRVLSAVLVTDKSNRSK